MLRLARHGRRGGTPMPSTCVFCVYACVFRALGRHACRLLDASEYVSHQHATKRRRVTPLPSALVVFQLVPPDTVCTGNGCSFDQSFAGSALPLEGGRVFQVRHAFSARAEGSSLPVCLFDDARWFVCTIGCEWKGSLLHYSENANTVLRCFFSGRCESWSGGLP